MCVNVWSSTDLEGGEMVLFFHVA